MLTSLIFEEMDVSHSSPKEIIKNQILREYKNDERENRDDEALISHSFYIMDNYNDCEVTMMQC